MKQCGRTGVRPYFVVVRSLLSVRNKTQIDADNHRFQISDFRVHIAMRAVNDGNADDTDSTDEHG